MRSITCLFVVVSVVQSGTVEIQAAGPCKPAYHARAANIVARSSASPCRPVPRVQTRVVEQQVMVPQTTTETRTVTEQQMQYRDCPQTITVYDNVPQVVNVNRTETVMVTSTQLQAQTRIVSQPVYRDVVEPVTVAVPGMQTRVGTRRVLVNVPVRVQIPVTRQCQCVTTGPGGISSATYQPAVTQMVEQVRMQQQWQNEQFTYQVPVTQYQTQYRTRRVVSYQPVQQTVNVPVQVQVPQQRVWTEPVVQYRQVPRQVTVNRKVAVPVTVQRQIEVPVTRMVPQTVRKSVTVPQCMPKPPCGMKPPCGK